MFRFGVYRVVYPVNHIFFSFQHLLNLEISLIKNEKKKKSRDHITERGGPNPRTKALFCFTLLLMRTKISSKKLNKWVVSKIPFGEDKQRESKWTLGHNPLLFFFPYTWGLTHVLIRISQLFWKKGKFLYELAVFFKTLEINRGLSSKVCQGGVLIISYDLQKRKEILKQNGSQ